MSEVVKHFKSLWDISVNNIIRILEFDRMLVHCTLMDDDKNF